jgi:microsomal dipeptidase-like Zn-dependent dipeptidase
MRIVRSGRQVVVIGIENGYLSKAPVIASHSAVRALRDHSRNLDDEQLRALKKNGGVTMRCGLELVRRGYSDSEIGTLWSGNLLRVWREAERIAQRLNKQG